MDYFDILKDISQYGIIAMCVLVFIFRGEFLVRSAVVFIAAAYIMFVTNLDTYRDIEFASWMLRMGVSIFLIYLMTYKKFTIPKILLRKKKEEEDVRQRDSNRE